MTTIGEYLNFIQGQHEIGKGGAKRKPSPTFAWELVKGKKYPGWRRGRPDFHTDEKPWRGMSVDAHLKDKWLADLNNIPNVEIRGTCEGHNSEWPTYIAFRISPKIENRRKLNDVVKKLNRDKFTRCGYDIGTEGRPRFVCASPLYYKGPDQPAWVKWWNSIAVRINKAVNS